MGFFPGAIAALLAGNPLRASPLVYFDFLDDPVGVWTGYGRLSAEDGKTYSGLGELGSISGLESAIGAQAPDVTFSLSGVDPSIIIPTLNASDQVKDRPVIVYMQFFDDAWQTVDPPYAIWS